MRIVFSAMAVLLAMGSAWAGQLTIPNTFTAGTPARATEVNQNFIAVKTAVDDNDTRDTTNAGNITTNASGVSTNATAISTETTRAQAAEAANATSITTNIGNITTNASGVSTNATAISTESTRAQAAEATNAANNTTNALMRIKANGQTVATFLGYLQGVVVMVGITNTGYIVGFDPSTGTMARNSNFGRESNWPILLYTNSNCTGNTYAAIKPTLGAQGTITATNDSTDPVDAYYVPKNSAPTQPPAALYRYSGNNCVLRTGGDVMTDPTLSTITNSWYQVYPNDPAVTGISFPLALPVTIGQ